MGKTEGRVYTVQVEGRGIVIVRDAVGKGVYEKGGYRFQRSTPPPPSYTITYIIMRYLNGTENWGCVENDYHSFFLPPPITYRRTGEKCKV